MRERWATIAVLIFSVWAGPAALEGQNAPGRVPYDGSDALNGPMPIHVDENCRVLPESQAMPAKKAKPYFDPAICSLESQAESQHWEEKIAGNQLERWFVRVKERTFVLRDIAEKPVMFLVQYELPKGWFVDSDPQPWQIVGQTA